MTTNPILDGYVEVITNATGLKIETDTVEGGYHIRVDGGMSQPLSHGRAWDLLSGIWMGAESLKRALDEIESNERRAEAIADAQARHNDAKLRDALGEPPRAARGATPPLADGTTPQDHYGHGCSIDPAKTSFNKADEITIPPPNAGT